MTLAIQVKYLGPSNTLGSRYKATMQGGASVTTHVDYSFSGSDNARRAAYELLARQEMPDRLSSVAWLPNGDFVFVTLDGA